MDCVETYYKYSNTCLKTLNDIVQIEIIKISNWLNVNKLSLYTVKTKFIVFTPKNKKKKNLKFKKNSNFIKQVKTNTFLGIVVDEFLT